MFTSTKERDVHNNVDATGIQCIELKHSENGRHRLPEDYSPEINVMF